MKRALVVISAVVLMIATSSCYRHHVCATYVKAEKKANTEIEVDENI